MKNVYDTIRHIEVTTNRLVTELFAGNYRSSFQGTGVEVEDVRPYAEGDNARLIDWATTAKLGEPYVKKFREVRELPMFVMVDVSPTMQFSSVQGIKKYNRIIEAVAILLFSAIKNGEAVGAIIFDQEVQSFIPPRKGRRHALRIIREIITAYTTAPKQAEASNIATALKYFNSRVKRHPICFLFTDQEVWDDAVKKELAVTNLRNDLVYVHVTDPFEEDITGTDAVLLNSQKGSYSTPFMLTDKRLQSAYRLRRHKKAEIRNMTLKRLHIDTLVLRTDEKVFTTLFSFFKKRQRQTRRSF